MSSAESITADYALVTSRSEYILVCSEFLALFKHDHVCIFFVSHSTQSRPESPSIRPFTGDPFTHISVEFGVTRVLSLETSEPRLEFKTSFCTFEQNLAMRHGFERWTGKVKQYTAGWLVMIFDATKPLQEFDKIATF